MRDIASLGEALNERTHAVVGVVSFFLLISPAVGGGKEVEALAHGLIERRVAGGVPGVVLVRETEDVAVVVGHA